MVGRETIRLEKPTLTENKAPANVVALYVSVIPSFIGFDIMGAGV